MKQTALPLCLMLASALALSACSATSTPAPAAPTATEEMSLTKKGGERSREVTIRAVVESVDLKKRTVKLKGFDGSRETIHVGDEVKNLPQVKKGDEVIVTYLKSIAFSVVDPKDAKLGVAGIQGRTTAEPGEKPGAVHGAVVLIVADILKIDRAGQEVQLRTDKGEIFSVAVERPEVFDRIKVGNRVAIQISEAAAIDVQPSR